MQGLEKLINHVSQDELSKIVTSIKGNDEGAQISLRLLAHKMQSPQEREALNALMYLGSQTPENVRNRCIELLYHWKTTYGEEEDKIKKSYDMLVDQGVIQKDLYYPKPYCYPVRQSNSPFRKSSKNISIKANPIVGSTQVQQQKSIFDDGIHAQTIPKLLKSTNPSDIEKANLLIKEVVLKNEEKLERLSKQKCEMEKTKENTKLLEQLISGFTKSEEEPIKITESERDIMSEVAKALLNSLPTLNSMATSQEDDEELMNEVISACDAAHEVLKLYEKLIKHSSIIVESTSTANNQNSDLLGLQSETVTPAVDLLNQPVIVGSSCNTDLSELDTAWITPESSLHNHKDASQVSLDKDKLLDEIFSADKSSGDKFLPAKFTSRLSIVAQFIFKY